MRAVRRADTIRPAVKSAPFKSGLALRSSAPMMSAFTNSMSGPRNFGETVVFPAPFGPANTTASGLSGVGTRSDPVSRLKLSVFPKTTPRPDAIPQELSCLTKTSSKCAYVDRSTNLVDWDVFGGQNVDRGIRIRSWWTGWTVVLTFFCQGEGRGFESRLPLQVTPCCAGGYLYFWG